MNQRDHLQRQLLIEQVCSAWRPRDRNGAIEGHPAWADISEADRAEVFKITIVLRQLEAAMDARGLSTTAAAVLERIEEQ